MVEETKKVFLDSLKNLEYKHKSYYPKQSIKDVSLSLKSIAKDIEKEMKEQQKVDSVPEDKTDSLEEFLSWAYDKTQKEKTKKAIFSLKNIINDVGKEVSMKNVNPSEGDSDYVDKESDKYEELKELFGSAEYQENNKEEKTKKETSKTLGDEDMGLPVTPPEEYYIDSDDERPVPEQVFYDPPAGEDPEGRVNPFSVPETPGVVNERTVINEGSGGDSGARNPERRRTSFDVDYSEKQNIVRTPYLK